MRARQPNRHVPAHHSWAGSGEWAVGCRRRLLTTTTEHRARGVALPRSGADVDLIRREKITIGVLPIMHDDLLNHWHITQRAECKDNRQPRVCLQICIAKRVGCCVDINSIDAELCAAIRLCTAHRGTLTMELHERCCAAESHRVAGKEERGGCVWGPRCDVSHRRGVGAV